MENEVCLDVKRIMLKCLYYKKKSKRVKIKDKDKRFKVFVEDYE
jgi:hypothetical protein